jgi:hypothetical protein
MVGHLQRAPYGRTDGGNRALGPDLSGLRLRSIAARGENEGVLVGERNSWGNRVAIGLVGVLAVAACGGDDDSSGDDDTSAGGDTVAADQPASSDGDDESAGAADTSGTSATLDPASMPGPGEAVLTVNGETIMYAPEDPTDTRLGTDAITVNMQTPDGHDLLVQVAPLDTGEWAGSIVGTSRDSDRNYQGTRTYAADAFAVDGQYMVFVGPFEYYLDGDPANFMDAGEGQIAVTCP